MSWLQIVDQLELDIAAYQRIADDPDAPMPPLWSPAVVAGPPPAALHGRLAAALEGLRSVQRRLTVAKASKAVELAGLTTTADPMPRYLDTTA